MIAHSTRYGISTTIPVGYEQAVARTRDALAAEGFGILSEVDVAATMKQKLGADFRPYVILGACNPPLAHRALTAERDIGLLLPCNVIVYADDVPGHSVVAAMDPVAALKLTNNDEITPIAEEVRNRLVRALEALATSICGAARVPPPVPHCLTDSSRARAHHPVHDGAGPGVRTRAR
jgi:uncharacterized protein (DUF302 family)